MIITDIFKYEIKVIKLDNYIITRLDIQNHKMDKIIYTLKPKIKRGMFSYLILILILILILSSISIPLLYVIVNELESKLIFNLGIVIYLFLIFILLLTFIIKYYVLKNTTYSIYKNKIIYERQFISIDKIVIPTEQITNIDSFESFFLDRMFKTGTLNIYTSGSSSVDISFKYVEDYINIYSTLNLMIQHIKEDIPFTKSDIISEDKNLTNTSNMTNTYNGENSRVSINEKNVSNNSKLLLVKPDIKSAISLNFLQLFFISTIFIITFVPFLLILIIGAIIQSENILLSLIISILLIVSVGIILLGIGYILKRRYSKIEYHFYSNRVEYFDGFFNIVKHTIPYERITNSNSYQGILERFFSVYTINIETAGSFSSTISIKYVKNGEEINQKILEILQDAGEN